MKNKFLNKQMRVYKIITTEEFYKPKSFTTVILDKKSINPITVLKKGGVAEVTPRWVLTLKKYSNISYEELVSGMIREKYTQPNVEAILANYLNDTTNETYKNEFTEFQTYRELCKNKAKEFIEERNALNK